MLSSFIRNGLFCNMMLFCLILEVCFMLMVFILVKIFEGFMLNLLMRWFIMVILNGRWWSLFLNFLNLLICCIENECFDCFLLCMSVSVLKLERYGSFRYFRCMMWGRWVVMMMCVVFLVWGRSDESFCLLKLFKLLMMRR